MNLEFRLSHFADRVIHAVVLGCLQLFEPGGKSNSFTGWKRIFLIVSDLILSISYVAQSMKTVFHNVAFKLQIQ